jgi:hypothetical protein
MHDFFTLFRYHVSICFGLIFSPLSGGQVYNVAMVLLLILKRLSAGLDTDPKTVDLEVKQVPLPHYTLGLLMMGYK